MAENNYLVMLTVPSNGESSVALTVRPRVQFQQSMLAASITPETVRFGKVNGDAIEATYQYTGISRTLEIVPLAPLEPGVQYQIKVIAGTEGVKTITGDWMGKERNYEFTTDPGEIRFEPSDVKVQTIDGFATISWTKNRDGAARLTVGKDADAQIQRVWPTMGEYSTTESSVEIPKRLEPGTYYVEVKGETTTATAMFAIEEQATGEAPSTGEPSMPTVQLHVVGTFPKDGSYQVEADRIGVKFSEPVDLTRYTDWVRLKETDRDDFFGDGSVSGKVLEVEAGVPSSMLLTFVPDEPLLAGTRYELVVQGAVGMPQGQQTIIVEGTEITVDGEPAEMDTIVHVHFDTKARHYYGSPKELIASAATFADTVDELELSREVARVSEEAYQRYRLMQSFDETAFEAGDVPYALGRFVFYSALRGMVLSQATSAAFSSGTNIRLADLSVEKGEASSNGVRPLLDELDGKIRFWLDALQGRTNRGYAKMTQAVYGEEGYEMGEFFDGYPEYPEVGQ